MYHQTDSGEGNQIKTELKMEEKIKEFYEKKKEFANDLFNAIKGMLYDSGIHSLVIMTDQNGNQWDDEGYDEDWVLENCLVELPIYDRKCDCVTMQRVEVVNLKLKEDRDSDTIYCVTEEGSNVWYSDLIENVDALTDIYNAIKIQLDNNKKNKNN